MSYSALAKVKSSKGFSAFYQSAALSTEPATEPKWAIRGRAGGIANWFNPMRMLPAEPYRPKYASLPNSAELGPEMGPYAALGNCKISAVGVSACIASTSLTSGAAFGVALGTITDAVLAASCKALEERWA